MQGLKNQHLNSNTMFMVSALWFNTSWNFHSLLWWEINSRWCKKFRHTGYNGASRNCKQERLNERGKDFCSKEQEDWVKTGTSCSEDVYLSYLGILVILVIKVALDLLYKSKLNTNKKLIMTCILFHFLRIIVHCLLNYIWLTNKRDKAFLYKILQINHSPLNITTSTNIQSQMIKARKAFLFVYQKSFLMLFKYTKIHLYTILYSYYNQWNKFNNL